MQSFCLPVLNESDIAFQFVVQADTVEEADALCTLDGSGIDIGLVTDCDQLEFDVEFSELPERYRLSSFQVLYNWPHGFPGMLGFYSLNDCFYIRLVIEETYCSNCFQRIGNECFSSVIDYGNNDDAFGFSYCNSNPIDSEAGMCEPYIVEFVNQTTLVIPYTSFLSDKFGDIPTVQVWIYDGSGQLVNMGITATFDAYPVTTINFDFGGLASGVIIIR